MDTVKQSTQVNIVNPWSNLVKGGLGAKPWFKVEAMVKVSQEKLRCSLGQEGSLNNNNQTFCAKQVGEHVDIGILFISHLSDA